MMETMEITLERFCKYAIRNYDPQMKVIIVSDPAESGTTNHIAVYFLNANEPLPPTQSELKKLLLFAKKPWLKKLAKVWG